YWFLRIDDTLCRRATRYLMRGRKSSLCKRIMSIKKIISLFLLSVALSLCNASHVSAQADDSAEPTTVSNVVDANLPWGAQRILPAKVPAEFNQLFDKILAEAGGKMAGGKREVLAWEGNYKSEPKANGMKTELQANFRKEGWQYSAIGNDGDVDLF